MRKRSCACLWTERYTRVLNHVKRTERDRFFWWTVPPLIYIYIYIPSQASISIYLVDTSFCCHVNSNKPHFNVISNQTTKTVCSIHCKTETLTWHVANKSAASGADIKLQKASELSLCVPSPHDSHHFKTEPGYNRLWIMTLMKH